MSHRAGLVREPPVGHYFDNSSPSLEATVRSLNDTRLVYSPGAKTKYSNAGVAVAGLALASAEERRFPEYLASAVLRPMGLEDSAFEPESAIAPRIAKATMWTLDNRTFLAPTFQLGMAPAGSMYSTVLDLGRFMSVLFARGSTSCGPRNLRRRAPVPVLALGSTSRPLMGIASFGMAAPSTVSRPSWRHSPTIALAL
jgi:CubicO group peptidase (beta-lactamase class C family)